MSPDGIKSRFSNRFELASLYIRVASWAAIVAGIVVMVGWILNVPVVTRLSPGLASMKFNTALCFSLCGFALLNAISYRTSNEVQSKIASVLVTIIATLSLLSYWMPVPIVLDEIFVADLQSDPTKVSPGRMSAATAQCFLTLSIALALVRVRRFSVIRPTEILSMITVYGGLVGTLGYLFNISALYTFFPYASMALHTSILMVLLGVGGIFAQPKGGLVKELMSRYVGGVLARRILPITLIVPIVLGWLRLQGENVGLYPFEIGLILYIVIIFTILLLIVWLAARHLNNLEAELREKGEELQRVANIVASSRDGIFSKSLEGVIASWNSGAERLFGYTEEEMIGEKSTVLMSEAQRDLIHASLEEILIGKRPTPFETKIPKKDGQLIDVSISVSAVFGADNRLIGSSVIATDVTERKRLDRELRHTLEDLTAFKQALDEHAIVAITDASGKIKYVNQRFCEISKFPKEELVGQDHRLVNSGYHSKEFIKNLWDTIRSGNVWRGEIRNRAKDGSHYWVETTIVPFLDDHGKIVEYLAIRADITGTKEAQEDLIRSNKDLEHFAYVASHDLQEPLRAVSGCLGMLERRCKDQLDDKAKELIAHSVDGAERMQTLIEGLLEYSRVNTQSEDFTTVDLNAAVQGALRNLTKSIEESGAEIETSTLPQIQGIRSQLDLLFQNLISNAIKFRGDKTPKIEIGFNAEPGGDVVYVKDNGIGIEEKYFERIYVIFKRLHTRSEYPGTGIGLAICKRIVERHGGDMRVESRLGDGSTFTCFFPKDPARNDNETSPTHE